MIAGRGPSERDGHSPCDNASGVPRKVRARASKPTAWAQVAARSRAVGTKARKRGCPTEARRW